jgi:hypothetical protein
MKQSSTVGQMLYSVGNLLVRTTYGLLYDATGSFAYYSDSKQTAYGNIIMTVI